MSRNTSRANKPATLAQASTPHIAAFPSESLTIGAGFAIFHISTARVVVCFHSREKHWFLPKGRRNANEGTGRAAEREGFEESGYRNRLLPLPIRHRQPDPDEGHEDLVTEPLWTQLMPVSRTSQYILFWYAAETLPAEEEQALQALAQSSSSEGLGESTPNPPRRIYTSPSPFPKGLTLAQRIQQDRGSESSSGTAAVYEPVRHEGTGVDADELLYESYLLPIDDACRRLRGTIMEDVVRRGWAGIEQRLKHGL